MTKPINASLGTTLVWRIDEWLVTTWGAQLDPERCVKCNAPSDGEVVVNTYPYHRPLFYFASRIFPIVRTYRTLTEYSQKDASVGVFVCKTHRKRRYYAMLLIRSLGIGGVLLFVLNIITYQSFAGGVVAGGMCVVSLDCLPFFTRVLQAERIDKQYVWLAGASPLYLAKVPKMPMELRRFD